MRADDPFPPHVLPFSFQVMAAFLSAIRQSGRAPRIAILDPNDWIQNIEGRVVARCAKAKGTKRSKGKEFALYTHPEHFDQILVPIITGGHWTFALVDSRDNSVKASGDRM